MKSASIVCTVLLVSACAATGPDRDTAVRDFIAVNELSEADRIETTSRDSQDLIGDRFLVYMTRRGSYLIEFNSPCRAIRERRIVPDTRWDARYIRPRVDTLSGCQIKRIYSLSESQYDELANLGDAPGDRL